MCHLFVALPAGLHSFFTALYWWKPYANKMTAGAWEQLLKSLGKKTYANKMTVGESFWALGFRSGAILHT